MIKSVFYPGESWVYYKLYCSPRTADRFLSEILRPLINKLYHEELIEKWFFIRYRDPEHHVRLRLKKEASQNIDAILNHALDALSHFLDYKLIYKIQLDGYIREMERYGEQTIDLCESIFQEDSELALTITSFCISDIQLVAWTLDQIRHYVDCFKLSDQEAQLFYRSRRDAFFKEFNISGKRKLAFRKKFEREKEAIDKFDSSNLSCHDLILEKRKNIQALSGQVLSKLASNSKTLGKESLLGSLIHMSANRIYRDEQRMYEMICYDYMCRLVPANRTEERN